MFLVFGLGNPGRKYETTRHNAGFLVVDRLAQRHGERIDRALLGAETVKFRLHGQEVVLAKPQSFMNLSGQPGVSLKGYFKVELPQVVVVHDELDLSFGDVRIKVGGGHGGHNGLRDLSLKFGDPNYVRVRFGITRPTTGQEVASYVLASWSSAELATLDAVVDRAVDAVEAVVRDGVSAAMNVVNTRSSSKNPP